MAGTDFANKQRVRVVKEGAETGGPVVYWMSRDQRVRDNWALLFAQERALERNVPLAVVFCLVPQFLGATIRQYGFMLRGLEEVAKGLAEKGISFHLLAGNPEEELPAFVARHRAALLCTDFDPLRVKQAWQRAVKERIHSTFYEVDAHNIVPCRVVSQKREYGAFTLRPKLSRLMPEFLVEFPVLKKHPVPWPSATGQPDWRAVIDTLPVDRSVPEVTWIKPGEAAARRMLKEFLAHGLPFYDERRNNPTGGGQSNLSPYLHFGQLSAQRVALEVIRRGDGGISPESFLEELVVRRELSDNLCLYNPDYDSFAGFPAWAQKTLDEHRGDPRPYLYSRREFERGGTHDSLWNAAQLEMVKTGKMHGYLRMYWAKKILEWSGSPEYALETAIWLNDRYELDGRDPNGYAGIAWSIGGVHDRAWGSRPVFGKVRYMSYAGCKGKFDVGAYIQKIAVLS